jgi:hypothetical protein
MRFAAVDRGAVGQDLGDNTAADAVAGLEHGHGPACLLEFVGRGQARKARADDAEVRLQSIHGLLSFHGDQLMGQTRGGTRIQRRQKDCQARPDSERGHGGRPWNAAMSR